MKCPKCSSLAYHYLIGVGFEDDAYCPTCGYQGELDHASLTEDEVDQILHDAGIDAEASLAALLQSLGGA